MFHIYNNGWGVHPDAKKNTADLPTIRLESFTKVQMPMSMHIGVPCTPCVTVGDDVAIGQKIGDSDAFMSVPIHASISGKVMAVKKVVSSTGGSVEVVEIESDGLNRIHESVVPPLISSRTDFIKAIRESGLVGLGGASFPTHIKMSPPKGKEPDILVINAAECEPYITADYRHILEHSDEIIEGIEAVLKWLGIPRAVIGIEDNKRDAARLLEFNIRKYGCADRIRVKILKTIYPQGAEKPLI